MKRRMFVANLVLAVLGSVSLAAPAVGGELVPFVGTLEGIEVAATPPPIVSIDGAGGGQATQLGRFTYDMQATVDLTNTPPNPPQGMGTLTLTAANGDTLVVGFTGVSVPVIPGQLILITEQALIVDGTGRFAGASGEFTITRLKYQADGYTIGSFAGLISTPDGD